MPIFEATSPSKKSSNKNIPLKRINIRRLDDGSFLFDGSGEDGKGNYRSQEMSFKDPAALAKKVSSAFGQMSISPEQQAKIGKVKFGKKST